MSSSCPSPISDLINIEPNGIEDVERSHIANLILTALILPRITTAPPRIDELVATALTTTLPAQLEISTENIVKIIETTTHHGNNNPTGSTPAPVTILADITEITTSVTESATETTPSTMSSSKPPTYVTLPPLSPGSLGGIIREALGLVQNTIRVVGLNLLGNQALVGNPPPGLVRINETHFKLVGTRGEEVENGKIINH